MVCAILIKNGEGISRIFVATVDCSKAFGAWVLPRKGNSISAAQRAVRWINGFGHGKIILKCDQGPAVAYLHEGLKKERQSAVAEIAKHSSSLGGFGDDIGRGMDCAGKFTGCSITV